MHGIDGWRWLFLIEGVATVAIGFGCAFILPNSIQSARWLTETEKIHLAHSLEVDRGQKDNASDVGVGTALVMASTDPKTWLACGLLFFTYVRGLCIVRDYSVRAPGLTPPPSLPCFHACCLQVAAAVSNVRTHHRPSLSHPLCL